MPRSRRRSGRERTATDIVSGVGFHVVSVHNRVQLSVLLLCSDRTIDLTSLNNVSLVVQCATSVEMFCTVHLPFVSKGQTAAKVFVMHVRHVQVFSHYRLRNKVGPFLRSNIFTKTVVLFVCVVYKYLFLCCCF